MCLLLFSLALAGAPAAPAPAPTAPVLPPVPTEAEADAWSAVAYNDFLVHGQMVVLRELSRRISSQTAAVQTKEAFDADLRDLRAVVQAGLDNARALPDWHDDPTFRDALVVAFATLLPQLDDDLPRFWYLTTRPDVRDADLTEAEAVYRNMLDQTAQSDRALSAAQEEFARRHGFQILVAEPPPKAEEARFRAPGLPPAGSVLGADVHVGFATRYHNRLVEAEVRVVDAENAFLVATKGPPAELEAAREAALQVVRTELAAARARGAWQGDDSLRAALVSAAEQVEAQLEGDLATYTTLRQQLRITQADADRINTLGRDAGPRLQTTIDSFKAAQTAFQERWGIAAYQAWLAAGKP